MQHWATLLHLGDPALTVPAALGIAAWLAALGAWRAAAAWLLLFGAALGLVGVDKLAFLGWGTGLRGIDYHAASGHAAGVTAVWPLLLALLLPGRRRAAIGAGLALGLAMAALLVALDEHSVAEALAGWSVGALASVAALALAGPLPARTARALPIFAGVFLAAALPLQAAPTGYWLMRTALLLSGQLHPFPLHH